MVYTTGHRLLSIQNVTVKLGEGDNEKVILRDVNAEIYDAIQDRGPVRGQVVGFISPSGMGKTTLFRVMAGLLQPDIGAVYVNADQTPVVAGEVGVLAQHYPLDKTRTAIENLILAAKLSGCNPAQCRDLVKEKLGRFGLWDVRNHYPGELSGGQRQRIAYIQQILCSKHFLLMDEPYSGLDVLAKDEVSSQILEYANTDEINTIVITSHDIRSVCAVADHVWLLGRDHDETGKSIPGARVQKIYDLIEMDLAWQPDITSSPRFLEFITMIEKQDFPTLH